MYFIYKFVRLANFNNKNFFKKKMGEIEINYGSTLPTESLKVIAESVGIGNLSDDAAKEISDSATYRLKLVLQVYVFTSFFYIFI